MKSKRGFTLIELLVVMAIIAILASIVVPNVAQYIRQARATRALGDIESMELALTKMLADCDRSSLGHLFNDPEKVEDIALLNINNPQLALPVADLFQASLAVYTRTVYALLRQGRGVLGSAARDTILFGEDGDYLLYGSLLDMNTIRRLGTSYLDVEFDPWRNLYNIYPGPWPGRYSPLPFRIYLPEQTTGLPGESANRRDNFGAVIADPDSGETNLYVGYPAPKNKVAYIWSNGENLRNSQILYENVNRYDLGQSEEFKGGGDDINNWDNSRSWMRFYN